VLERFSSALSMLTSFGLGTMVMATASPAPEPVHLRDASWMAARDPIGVLVRNSVETEKDVPVAPQRVVTANTPLPDWFASKPIESDSRSGSDVSGAGRFAIAPMPVPAPRPAIRPRPKSVWPTTSHRAHAITTLVALQSAPFPYDGTVPGHDGAFLDVEEDGRRGHGASRGRVFWADETYSDPRSLLHIPAGFDASRPGVLVLFFHGHHATLTRDVWQRQQLPQQVSGSEMNAVLVAPQFAFDAADSSSGKFWQKDGLRRYMREVAAQLARLYGSSRARRVFERMPVVVVAYSGGFAPAAWAVEAGGLGQRLRGVLLLDAMYGHQQTFERWATDLKRGFFVNVYGHSTARRSRELEARLTEQKIVVANALPDQLGQGEVVSIAADVPHRDYVSMAWAPNPVADILRRLRFAAPIRSQSRVAGGWH
jgi:hypothetical protein